MIPQNRICLNKSHPNNHTGIFGKSGSGKTYRAFKMACQNPGITIYVDPNRCINGGIEKVKDLKFTSKMNVIYLDYTDDIEFNKLTAYLFEIYRSGKYNKRLSLYLDEADEFCKCGSESVERLITKGRRFFDVTFISQKPSLMRTSHGYVALSQAHNFILYDLIPRDYETIEDCVGLQFTPEIIAHLSQKYHYIVFNCNGLRFFNNDGQEITYKNNADTV